MLAEFTHLRKKFWGRHLWARGYFVCSSGNVTDDVIAAYIEHQSEMTGTDDGFRVEGQDAARPTPGRDDASPPRPARQEADFQSAPPKPPLQAGVVDFQPAAELATEVPQFRAWRRSPNLHFSFAVTIR